MTSDRKYWDPLLVCGLFAALSKLLSEATDLTLSHGPSALAHSISCSY